MKSGYVPTSRVGPVLDRLIQRRWPDGGGIEALSRLADCDGSAIEAILKQENEGADFDVVDRLICLLDRLDVWQGELLDVYEAVDLSVGKCAAPDCLRTFPVGRIQEGRTIRRYCSSSCVNAAKKIRLGVHRRRFRLDRNKPNTWQCGHERTPENTKARKDRPGHGQCRQCYNQRNRESAARRKQNPEYAARERARNSEWKRANRTKVAA